MVVKVKPSTTSISEQETINNLASALNRTAFDTMFPLFPITIHSKQEKVFGRKISPITP